MQSCLSFKVRFEPRAVTIYLFVSQSPLAKGSRAVDAKSKDFSDSSKYFSIRWLPVKLPKGPLLRAMLADGPPFPLKTPEPAENGGGGVMRGGRPGSLALGPSPSGPDWPSSGEREERRASARGPTPFLFLPFSPPWLPQLPSLSRPSLLRSRPACHPARR